MTPLELLLTKLPDAKKAGSGWSARCPAHDDRRASLSIGEGHDGIAMVKCHAGCDTSSVLTAIGLQLTDLFPKDGTITKQQNKAPAPAFKSANHAIKALEVKQGIRSAIWTYHDSNGEPVGVVVRWDRPNGKHIRPVSKHSDGWQIGAMASPRPVYQLPEVLKAGIVIVTEGEKAADAAQLLGFIATTSAGGAQAAKQTDWLSLAGREVWIIPDNDLPGRKYAAEVAGILVTLVPPSTVRIVELPSLPVKGDIVDWIEAHGDAAEPQVMREEIEDLAQGVQPWRPNACSNQVDDSSTDGPVLVCLADVAAKPVAWLWDGKVPLGRITLLVGFPGEGKSILTTDMASRVSTGTPWPDNTVCPHGSVIFICAEDNPGDTIRPRLDAHLADCTKIHILTMVKRSSNGKQNETMFSLTDIDALEKTLQQVPACKLIIIDPIGSYLGGKVDAHRDNEVRSVLAPVAQLADKYGPAVLVVCHRNKGRGSRADDLAMGSRAFTGIARTVWHLSRDTQDKKRLLLLPGKNNLAPEGDGLAFTIQGQPPAIVWERESVRMNADEALAAENGNGDERKPGPEPKVRNAAKKWLAELLHAGGMTTQSIKQEAESAELAWRTVQRAAEELDIVRTKDQFSGNWRWSIPPPDK